MSLDPEELNPTDNAILDELHHGRCTPAYIAETHGYSAGNVRNRMTHLASHDHVRGLGGGLYELADDPRGDSAAESPPETTADTPEPDAAVDMDALECARDALDRALDELPDDVPGASTVADARAYLEEALDDADV